MARGLVGAMANPSPTDKAQSPWARRMMAAHTNAVENLVIFAPLVLTARALSIATAVTAFACALYFWSRLAHAVVYTLGIPVLRTLSFAGGFVGIVNPGGQVSDSYSLSPVHETGGSIISFTGGFAGAVGSRLAIASLDDGAGAGAGSYPDPMIASWNARLTA